MKQIMNAIVVVAFLSIPTAADEYPWKALPPFEILFIDGYREIYGPGEQIVFYVYGRSPCRVEAEPQAGFHVQAYIFNHKEKHTYLSANGKYDENRRAWLITLTAPTDNTKSYELSVALYCSNDESPCAEIYGVAAQTVKKFSLQVQ